MANSIETPVLIVGAGPVGLALAVELGWRSVPCVLIEQSDGKIGTPKMNEVNTRTMEFCRRWGIADDVMSCPFPDDWPMDVVLATKIGSYELGRIPRASRNDQKPGLDSPMNLQVCSQLWFDPILRKKAERLPSVRLLYRYRLESFSTDPDGVTACVRDLDADQEITIRCSDLAACDGAGSRVRQAVGIDLRGKPDLSSSMHIYFRHTDALGVVGVAPGTFFAMVDQNGYWGNVRAIDPANGLWRLLFDVPSDFDPKTLDRDACLQRAFAKPIEVEWVGASLWQRRGVVADHYSEDRIHLVGDSAHQVSPTGALGMNTGIGDAVDLGWKLAGVVEGWASRELLKTYSIERQKVGARNVDLTTQFYEGQAEFSEGLSAIEDATDEGAKLRARVGSDLKAFIGRVFRTMGLQIGYVYSESPAIIPDGTAQPADDPSEYKPTTWPGARAPHAWLADRRSTLDLFGNGFVLLNFDVKRINTKTIEAAAARRHMPFQAVAIEEPAVAKLYERPLVLVRPDGHVAWRGLDVPGAADSLIQRLCGVWEAYPPCAFRKNGQRFR